MSSHGLQVRDYDFNCIFACVYILCTFFLMKFHLSYFSPFFRDCLKGTTINSENVQINCPFVDDDGVECNETISEREIREVRECLHYSI